MLRASFQEDLFQKGQYGFVTTAILDFFCISCNMIDASDRIISTNNKGGSVVISAVNIRFMTTGCFLQVNIMMARNLCTEVYLLYIDDTRI